MDLDGKLFTIIKDLKTYNWLEEESFNYKYPVSCTKDFLNNYYDGDVNEWMEDNKTNRGCFNCIGCRNCVSCKGCIDCKDCYSCWNCEDCIKCKYLDDAGGLKNESEKRDDKKYKQPFNCKL